MYGTEEYAKAIEELGKAGESMAVAFAPFQGSNRCCVFCRDLCRDE